MTYDSIIRELLQFVKSDERKKAILSRKFGEGGLHYCCGSGLYHDVICVDAKSFYPHILLNWDLLPDWIDREKYKEMLNQRMSGNKDERLKMALNIPTGKLRASNASAEDKERGLAMCLIGQVLISVLQEMIESAGYRTLQVNTDGIMVQKLVGYGNSKPQSFKTMIEEWARLFDIPLSVKDIEHLVQEDVNNYKAIFADGTIVNKGAKFKPKGKK